MNPITAPSLPRLSVTHIFGSGDWEVFPPSLVLREGAGGWVKKMVIQQK